MEWGNKENRITVSALQKVGIEPNTVFNVLHIVGISQMLVYRTSITKPTRPVHVVKSTRPVHVVKSTRPRSVRTKKAIKAVGRRIRKNAGLKQKILSGNVKIAPRTVSHILKDDLRLAVYKRCAGHFLTDKLKKNRVVKSKLLIKRYIKGVTEKKILQLECFLQLINILTIFMLTRGS